MWMHHYCTIAGKALFEPDEKYFHDGNIERIASEKVIECDSKTEESSVSEFSAEDFVERLLHDATQYPCDETSDAFNDNTDIPKFYNEKLFKKGQEFFYKNITSLFLSNIIGLLVVLCFPESLKILKMTNKSSTPKTAYKRYMATIFHMMTWYDYDFKPGSGSWSSLRKVRHLHNSASKKSDSVFKYRISQKYMSLTLFGFMGFGLVRSKMFGIHHATKEEMKGFVHLWRVVGYALGIEDRYNICRESVAETTQICNALIEKVFLPAMKKPHDDFYLLTKAMMEGLSAMNPILHYEVFTHFAHMAMEGDSRVSFAREYLPELGDKERKHLKFVVDVMGLMRFGVVRVLFNFLQVLSLWIMRVCPFLAIRRYGVEDSYVRI